MFDGLTQPVATLLAGSAVALAAVVTFLSGWLTRKLDREHFRTAREGERQQFESE